MHCLLLITLPNGRHVRFITLGVAPALFLHILVQLSTLAQRLEPVLQLRLPDLSLLQEERFLSLADCLAFVTHKLSLPLNALVRAVSLDLLLHHAGHFGLVE